MPRLARTISAAPKNLGIFADVWSQVSNALQHNFHKIIEPKGCSTCKLSI